MKAYPFKEIESKWQKKWEESKIYQAPDHPQKKYFMLVMYAYPSGDIHIGHFRNFIIGDTVARYKMMHGYQVLHPFGWDAFGLPAELAAIERKIHPKEWTMENIKVSDATLKRCGISFDWSREVITCEPEYYKWTQWMFLKLYEHGLAYQDIAFVNWCPDCKTVLANEQVVQGKCWRCDSVVEEKELKQWFFRITAYAERLLKDLDKLEWWPENTKTLQRNWIGKSEGVEIDFTIEGTDQKISVFTTRPDTIYGVTFMAIAPENKLIKSLKMDSEHKSAVKEYIRKASKKSEIDRTAVGEKDGVFTGVYAINPLSGENVQLWVADYVLATYGTGIVMGVPAHDQRDFEFCRKYGIPIKVVIQPTDRKLLAENMEEAYTEPGTMVNSDIFNGLFSKEGIDKINQYAVEKGLGRLKTNYKLRDWNISRQRYWGAPIPMIHCENCGVVPVNESDLPVLLPERDIDFRPKGRSPLSDSEEFMDVNCPKCGKKAKRDPDTMDTFVCSSWYFLRYTDAHNSKEPFSKAKAKEWLPVDKYIGGIEHACGHLLYFRFFTKFLHDIGWLEVDEPATELFNHGMVLDKEGRVMSKSLGNVVSPVDIINKHGADVSRITMYFAAPSEREILWSEEGIVGATRFLNRIYKFAQMAGGKNLKEKLRPDKLTPSDLKAYKKVNQTIKKVEEDIGTLQFNTAIASMMELLNVMDGLDTEKSKVLGFCVQKLAQILAPFAPHLSEEIWAILGNKESVFKSQWPSYDKEVIKEEKITFVVQVNGKLRATMSLLVNTPEEEAKKLALSNEKVKKFIQDKKIIKSIFVPNKLINIVVR
ncbi:MAG: leucine--tRNA ligase [candidate division Zixibacteria bacterium]|nr:leucine--tRNA ligase [candidate division Zixibacteria bacterium]